MKPLGGGRDIEPPIPDLIKYRDEMGAIHLTIASRLEDGAGAAGCGLSERQYSFIGCPTRIPAGRARRS